MDSKIPSERGLTAGELLDPSNPLVLWVVLPAAVLAALGMRKPAVFWILASVVWSVGSRIV